ncbi:MAG: helix-turn-helix transcriptional regulator [Microthrixaceae bacterium]
MTTKPDTTSWSELRSQRPSPAASRAATDEARITAFRELVHRLRRDAGFTQAELAGRMGTTQSAIARMEGGGTRPTLETLEKLATAVGADLVVGVGENLSQHRTNTRSSSAKATQSSAVLADRTSTGPRSSMAGGE